jgi:ATP-dependent Clp protease, protease subunit
MSTYVFQKKSAKKRKRERIDPDHEEVNLEKITKLFGNGGDNIDTEKNHIYFYGDVNTENCLKLNQEILNLTRTLQKYSIDYNTESPKIFLHINSYGGDLLACFSSVDVIKYNKIPIVSIIEGSAASAATLMSVVASERYITPHAFMLIHQLRSGLWGKYEDLKEDMVNSERFMEMIYDIYLNHTKLKRKNLKKLLKKDLWWDSKTCITKGLVDGIWDRDYVHFSVQNNSTVDSEDE